MGIVFPFLVNLLLPSAGASICFAQSSSGWR